MESNLPSLPAAAMLDAEGRVRVDAPCTQCGYNLRTLQAYATCPECGSPVEYSLHGYFLECSSPPWLRRIAWGSWLLVIATALHMLAGLAVIVWSASFGMRYGAGTAPALDPRAVTLVSLTAFAPVVVMNFVGLLLFTAPNPADTLPGTDSAARRWLRRGLGLYAAATLFGWFVGLTPASLLSAGPRNTLTALDMPVSIAVNTLTAILALHYIGQLMARVPRPGLVRFARICFWGVLNCGFLVALIYLVMAGVIAQNMAAVSTPTTAPGATPVPFGASAPPAPATGVAMMLAACPSCVGVGFFVAAFVLLIMTSSALSWAAREARQNAALLAGRSPASEVLS